MTWALLVYVRTQQEAEHLHTQIARQSIGVPGVQLSAYEVCEVDYMAGQLCTLPAGHHEIEGTPHR
jgi:hypothetical protein